MKKSIKPVDLLITTLATLLLLAAVPSRAAAQSAAASNPTPTPAPKYGANAEYDPSQIEPGRPKWIDKPTTIGTYLIQGYVCYWKDGSLNQCRLAADAQIQGLTIPKGSTIWFYPGAKKIRRLWLSRNMTIQGIPCAGTRSSVGIDAVFYPSGKLEGAFVSTPTTIQGLPVKKSGLCPLYLFEDGKIKQCTLDKPAKVAEKQYPKDLTLFFDENGQVVKTAPMPTKMNILTDMFSHLFSRNKKK